MTEETIPTTPADPTRARPQRRRRTGRTIALAVGLAVLLAALAAVGYGLATHPSFTAVFRDITIILLALMTIVIGLFLAILILQLQSLISLLRHDIKPLLDSANEAARTVRGTTVFLSETVVNPVITASSYATALRQTFRALVRSGRKGRRRQSKAS